MDHMDQKGHILKQWENIYLMFSYTLKFSNFRNLQIMPEVSRLTILQQSAQAGTGYATL